MHGYNGTVVLVSDRVLNGDPERLEEVFVVIDGLQVPFPVEELTLLTDTSAHLRLEFVENQNEALGLIGCEVFAEVAPYEEHDMEAGPEPWIGFTVHDTGGYGKIGVIRGIEDYSGNIVMQVMDGDRETLLSLYPELVTGVNSHAKILYIAAPDGYFDSTDDE
jgi:16S rRNA processing protein RimM